MYQIKRSAESHQSFPPNTKKLRIGTLKTGISVVTLLEYLSNELFYEVFEYLDSGDIYAAFSNLNSRFERLITRSSFALKIKLHSKASLELSDCCKNVIIPNCHQITSLEWENSSLIDDFSNYCILDSSFTRLQSLVFHEMSFNKALVLLFYLKTLPRLSSLTMEIDADEDVRFSDIYRMILSLSSLKHNKLSLTSFFDIDNMNILVPLAANEQPSPLEHLVIDHRCTDVELLSILQHTVRLRQLICANLVEFEYFNRIEYSMALSNLTYIRFDAFYGDLDDFRTFIAKLSAPVEEMMINNVFDDSYLDAARWEQVITQQMPLLRRLEFTYADYSRFGDDNVPSAEIIHRFSSLFWIERQCFLEVDIGDYRVLYSIRSSKNILLDVYKHAEIATNCAATIDNSSSQLIQLSVGRTSSDEPPQSFLETIKTRVINVQFTRLNINCKHISLGIFVRIIHMLPHLNSLKVSFFPSIQSDCLFDDDAQIRFLISINNEITKVNLEKAVDVEQIHFILFLSLRIRYFQMDVLEDMDLPTILRFILLKATTYIPHLKTVCLTLPNPNEKIVHQLHTLIESEELLTDYIMKWIDNHLLLKWK